jgi:hypothetical protein
MQHDEECMATPDTIETYLTQMGVTYEAVRNDTWILRDPDAALEGMVIALNDPVVVFHVTLNDVPADCDRLRLYEELLGLNASEMVHGAYGLQGNRIVATDTLQAANLDFNEFQASVDALQMSIHTHYRRLLPLLGRA